MRDAAVIQDVPLSVSFTVYGVAQPAGSKVAGRTKDGRGFVRDAARKSAPWKRQVAQAAGDAVWTVQEAGLYQVTSGLLDGPLALRCNFYVPRPKSHTGKRGLLPSAPIYPTTRPDVTKLVRAVEDALTGVVWRDDAQVVSQAAAKHYGEPARVEVEVSVLA